MANPIIEELYEYIQNNLDESCILDSKQDYLIIQGSTLPFDVYILQKINPYYSENSSKRKVIISEQQLLHQFDKITYRLKVLSGNARKIYARQTVVARIDKKQSLLFQEEHHLQIPIPGKYRYALYFKGELVSLAVFSGGRRMREKDENYRSFELIRFCHKSDYLIIGGLSKLLNSFIKDFKPGDIMTYVDRDWSQDSSLKKLGFQEHGFRAGETFWISEQKQYCIQTEADLIKYTHIQREGFLYQNSGSTKLVKII